MHTENRRKNQGQYKNSKVCKTPNQKSHTTDQNTNTADEIVPVNILNISLENKNDESNCIVNHDKLSDKRNELQFYNCFSEVPGDNLNDSCQNNAYIASSKKKLKSSNEINLQDSLIKQEEHSFLLFCHLNENFVVKHQEDFNTNISTNLNDILWSNLQPEIKDYNTDSQKNKVDEIQNYSNKILDNIENLKKLSAVGINDQDTFLQRGSADKFTISFQLDKLLLVRDGDDTLKILIFEPLNQLENKKSEIMINFHPGFAKLSIYGVIEVTVMITLNHLNCSTIKFVFEKISLHNSSKISGVNSFKLPYTQNENSKRNLGKKENTPSKSFIFTQIKYEDLQDGNGYKIQPKKVKLTKTTNINLKKLIRGPRGKYKKVYEKRKKGGGRKIMSHGLENYVLERIKEVTNNGTVIERRVVKMFADSYVNSQQHDINHTASKGWLDKFMKRNGIMILELNTKLGTIFDDFCKKARRTSLIKPKRISLKKKPEVKGTNKIPYENSVQIVNEAIDGRIKPKKNFSKKILCKSKNKIELQETHINTTGTTKVVSRDCFGNVSEQDHIFYSDLSN